MKESGEKQLKIQDSLRGKKPPSHQAVMPFSRFGRVPQCWDSLRLRSVSGLVEMVKVLHSFIPSSHHSLKASALSFALMVSLLMASVTAAFLLVISYQERQMHGMMIEEETSRDLDSAIEYLMSSSKRIPDFRKVPVLYERGSEQNLFVERSSWGAWELNRAWRYSRNDTLCKSFIAGFQVDSLKETALYLANLGNELAVGGGSKIEGNYFLPDGGWRRHYSGNKNVAAPQLRGRRRKSKRSLPKTDLTWYEKARESKQTIVGIGDSLVYSFAEEKIMLVENQLPKTAKGQIIIRSFRQVVLNGNYDYDQVIIEAPSIILRKGFKGALQLIATDSLIVEDGAELEFPSFIQLDSNSKDSFVRLESGSKVNGLVFCTAKQQQAGKFQMRKGALVNGVVHWNGMADVKGTIEGGLYCWRLRHQSPATIYEDMLMGGTLVSSKLEEYFLFPRIMGKNKERKILQWLN